MPDRVRQGRCLDRQEIERLVSDGNDRVIVQRIRNNHFRRSAGIADDDGAVLAFRKLIDEIPAGILFSRIVSGDRLEVGLAFLFLEFLFLKLLVAEILVVPVIIREGDRETEHNRHCKKQRKQTLFQFDHLLNPIAFIIILPVCKKSNLPPDFTQAIDEPPSL